jgi:ribonuclease HII
MHQAIEKLDKTPQHLIIDGNRFMKYKSIPHQCIVKGDSKYLSIAAASILAKTHRDEYMMKLHEKFPNYGWGKNKAYATKKHRDAIVKYGLSPYHRKSFRLVDEQLKLDF